MKVNIGKYPKNAFKDRKVSIQIDPWDTDSLDHTLAYIIHPALVKYREKINNNQSYPCFLTSCEDWLKILDCMIFSFEKKLNDDEGYVDDEEQTKKNMDQIQKGFDYFGKYYQSLWW